MPPVKFRMHMIIRIFMQKSRDFVNIFKEIFIEFEYFYSLADFSPFSSNCKSRINHLKEK